MAAVGLQIAAEPVPVEEAAAPERVFVVATETTKTNLLLALAFRSYVPVASVVSPGEQGIGAGDLVLNRVGLLPSLDDPAPGLWCRRGGGTSGGAPAEPSDGALSRPRQAGDRGRARRGEPAAPAHGARRPSRGAGGIAAALRRQAAVRQPRRRRRPLPRRAGAAGDARAGSGQRLVSPPRRARPGAARRRARGSAAARRRRRRRRRGPARRPAGEWRSSAAGGERVAVAAGPAEIATALRAVEAVGLDLACVDLIRDRAGRLAVLEVDGAAELTADEGFREETIEAAAERLLAGERPVRSVHRRHVG